MLCTQLEEGKIYVPLTSAVFNVISFTVLDIVVVAAIFSLTSDISGLINSASALERLGNRLHAYNPPLVGVGLTCTRKGVFRALALTRLLAMGAILATNFLIEGVTCEVVRREVRDVVVPAQITTNATQTDVQRHMLRRRSCVGRHENTTYYGELRTNHSCELRRGLMVQDTVFFGLKYINATVAPPKVGCTLTERDHMHSYSCPGFGVVGCVIDGYNVNMSRTDICEGVVLLGNESHMCFGEALFPGSPRQPRPATLSRTARCRLARGLNVSDESWVPLRHDLTRTLRDTVDAVYGAGTRPMEVRISSTARTRDKAEVHLAYFWLLAALVFLILALIIIDLALRSRGLFPTGHDETGLGSLLAQSAANAPLHVTDDGIAEFDSGPRVGAAGRPELFIVNDNGTLRARSSQR